MERLEFPIGPGGKSIVTDIGNLVNLSCTVVRVHAGTKFRDDEWDTKLLGILISLGNSLCVPFKAFLCSLWSWLSSLGADRWVQLTAVGVVIQDMGW